MQRLQVEKNIIVCDENQAALVLANKLPIMTPWSKQIAVNHNWFHSKVQAGSIEIKAMKHK